MTSYTNSYFNIKIDFPENWSWKSSSTTPNSKSQFQLSKDDLPSQEGDFRTLVTAIRKGRGKHKVVAGELCMGIHKQSRAHEPGEFENKDGVAELSYGDINILGKQAKFMSAVWQLEDYQRYSKTITYEIKPHIWLNIHINGESIEEFQAAKELLGKIISLDA